MTPDNKYHVVCRDCEFETVTDTRNGAKYQQDQHAVGTGHTVQWGQIQ